MEADRCRGLVSASRGQRHRLPNFNLSNDDVANEPKPKLAKPRTGTTSAPR
jgi:hypothetical protein